MSPPPKYIVTGNFDPVLRQHMMDEFSFGKMVAELIHVDGWRRIEFDCPIESLSLWAVMNLRGGWHSKHDWIVVERDEDYQKIKEATGVLQETVELDPRKAKNIESWCKKELGRRWNILHNSGGRWSIDMIYDGSRPSTERVYRRLSLRRSEDAVLYGLMWA